MTLRRLIGIALLAGKRVMATSAPSSANQANQRGQSLNRRRDSAKSSFELLCRLVSCAPEIFLTRPKISFDARLLELLRWKMRLSVQIQSAEFAISAFERCKARTRA